MPPLSLALAHHQLLEHFLLHITAFAIRAVLAGSESTGENFGLLIEDMRQTKVYGYLRTQDLVTGKCSGESAMLLTLQAFW